MSDVIDLETKRKQHQKRRFMFHARVVADTKNLTLGAMGLAGFIFHDYETGQKGYARFSLRGAAKKLGLAVSTIQDAKDLLVARGHLVPRFNSKKTGCYDFGPGPNCTGGSVHQLYRRTGTQS